MNFVYPLSLGFKLGNQCKKGLASSLLMCVALLASFQE